MKMYKKDIIKMYNLTIEDLNYLVNSNSINLNNIKEYDLNLLINISYLKDKIKLKNNLKFRPGIQRIFGYNIGVITLEMIKQKNEED